MIAAIHWTLANAAVLGFGWASAIFCLAVEEYGRNINSKDDLQ
jgi:hypothetical protein